MNARFVPIIAAAIGLCVPASAAEEIPVGAGSFKFTPDAKAPDRTLTVWTHRPKDLPADAPVVIVMHGVKRNGEGYRDSWLPQSLKYGFLLLVPEFPEAQYPSEQYHQGNVVDAKGKPTDPAAWTFTAVEKLFDDAKARSGNTSERYYLYGHSAGGQFVHRFVLFMPDARYAKAIAANPGYYTFPTQEAAFPYGLKGSPLSTTPSAKVFAKPFVLLLGEADTIRDDLNLRKTAEADAQGMTRFERGKNYFETAKATAAGTKATFAWKLATVPEVGHSDTKMAPAAAKELMAK